MGDRCERDEDNRGSLDCMFDDNRGTAIDLVNVVSDLHACLQSAKTNAKAKSFFDLCCCSM